MSKLILIGIDGMDPFLVKKFINSLPNIRYILRNGINPELKSVFPVDSIPAWNTIFTGLNPATHKIIKPIDYLKQGKNEYSPSNEFLKNRAFWDIASKNGKRVCIVNPFMAYPPWKVNGIMISGPVFVSEKWKIQSYPSNIVEEYNIPHLGGFSDLPTKKNLKKYAEDTLSDTYSVFEFGKKLFQKDNWDLFFLTFLNLDRIQHFYWRFFDEADPFYPGETEYKATIKEHYIAFDKIIGEFYKLIDDDRILMVISDHGHGMRPYKIFHINDFLQNIGLIRIRSYDSYRNRLNFIRNMIKTKLTRLIFEYGFQDYAVKLIRLIPKASNKKSSSIPIDKNNSLVEPSNFFGKGNYGGVNINTTNEQTKMDIKKILSEEMQKLNPFKEKFLLWIKTKEEMGIDRSNKEWPDIIFKLNDIFSIDMKINTPTLEMDYTHKLLSGGHKRDALLLFYNLNKKLADKKFTLCDISPSLLNLLDTEVEKEIDGRNKFDYSVWH